MDAETVKTLLRINRDFYSKFSGEFSGSRSGERLNLDPLHPYLRDNLHLLDVGCGNGRLAEALELWEYKLDYVGIDGSAELVSLARQRSASLKRIKPRFLVADLTVRGWSAEPGQAQPFDLIVSLAVLHHIPSFALRAQVLNEIRSLLRQGGTFVMSNWQFLNDERLRKKVVDWEKVKIAAERLERDDYLLDWKRGGTGYRYVHLLGENEVERLAQESGFTVSRQFLADNDLNLYSILEAKE